MPGKGPQRRRTHERLAQEAVRLAGHLDLAPQKRKDARKVLTCWDKRRSSVGSGEAGAAEASWEAGVRV